MGGMGCCRSHDRGSTDSAIRERIDHVDPTIHGKANGNVDTGHGVGPILDYKVDQLEAFASQLEKNSLDDTGWEETPAPPEEEFEGFWVHEKRPEMVEWIEGCTIRSYDGTLTQFKTRGPGTLSIIFHNKKLYD